MLLRVVGDGEAIGRTEDASRLSKLRDENSTHSFKYVFTTAILYLIIIFQMPFIENNIKHLFCLSLKLNIHVIGVIYYHLFVC